MNRVMLGITDSGVNAKPDLKTPLSSHSSPLLLSSPLPTLLSPFPLSPLLSLSLSSPLLSLSLLSSLYLSSLYLSSPLFSPSDSPLPEPLFFLPLLPPSLPPSPFYKLRQRSLCLVGVALTGSCCVLASCRKGLGSMGLHKLDGMSIGAV